MIHRSYIPSAILLSAMLCLPLVARAQYAPRPPEVKPEQLKATGTVKAMRAGVLQIATDEGEQWLVQIRARPQDVSFSAAADASYLKTGMLVRFVGTFNKRGQCLAPIGSLTIFTLREGYGVGIAPDTAVTAEGVQALFAEAKTEEKPAEKKDDSAAFRVAGQLTKLSRTGEMTINAGGKQIKANLAENATISVDINDVSNVREGDTIEVRGQYFPAQKGQAIATWVSISAKEPLTDPKKKLSVATPAEEKPAAEDDAKPEGEKKEEE